MKKLERSRGDRILFGVCGGLARYLGVSPDLVRVGWLVTVPLGGLGWVLYLAAYLLVPETAGDDASPEEDRSAKNGGLLLVALAVLIFLIQTGFDALVPWGWIRSWGILLPLLIFGAGALLVWPRARQGLGFSADRKLRRSVSDRVIGGVAGGIAHEADLDPSVVRLAFVVAGFVTWITPALYVLLLLVLPEEEVPGHAPAAAGPGPVPPAPPEAPAPPAPLAATGPPAAPPQTPPADQGSAETGR